jgi:Cu(I)/Ag(I) efflux system membrane fusion protein
MKRKATFVLATFLLAVGLLTSCRSEAPPSTQYYCPMHPSFVSDEPGECGICGMTLVRKEAEAPLPHAVADPSRPDRVSIDVSPERRRLLGVATAPVRRRSLGRALRTVGRVAVDERRVHHVHTKFEGFVEQLDVDFTGKLVRKGDRLLSIYSPELVATQEEYLLAYRAQQQLSESGIASVAQGSRDLLEAARRRLLLWDIQPEDIEKLERRGEARRALDLYADMGGTVIEKDVVHGMRVTPADRLFDIADLSYLWVLADVYEAELDVVRLGMRGEVTVTHLPERSWRGPITWISPTVEEATRTVKVRLEIDNRGDELKPEMFVDVQFRSEVAESLVVPEDAVIDTGKRKLVFVESAEGRFEPRDVVLGPKAGDVYPVLQGIAEGESVVTKANFLIDSESSLKAVLGGAGAPAKAPAHQH